MTVQDEESHRVVYIRPISFCYGSDDSQTMPVFFYLFMCCRIVFVRARERGPLGAYDDPISISAGQYTNQRLLVLDLGKYFQRGCDKGPGVYEKGRYQPGVHWSCGYR